MKGVISMDMKELKAIREKNLEIKALETDVKKIELISSAIPKVHKFYAHLRQTFLGEIVNGIVECQNSRFSFHPKIIDKDYIYDDSVSGPFRQNDISDILKDKDQKDDYYIDSIKYFFYEFNQFYNKSNGSSEYLAWHSASASDADLKEFFLKIENKKITNKLCIYLAFTRLMDELVLNRFRFGDPTSVYGVDVDFSHVKDDADLSLSTPFKSLDPANMLNNVEQLQERIDSLKPRVEGLLYLNNNLKPKNKKEKKKQSAAVR